MADTTQNKENENTIYVIRYQQKFEGLTLSGINSFYKTQSSAQKELLKLTDFYLRIGYTIKNKQDDIVNLTDSHDGSLKIYVSPEYIEP